MNFCEPCLFSKLAVREEPEADGGKVAPGGFGVDDYLMGCPGKAHHNSMERPRRRIMFGKWHRLLQDGPSFFGGRHFSCLVEVSRLT